MDKKEVDVKHAGSKILIADDEVEIRDLINGFLTKVGYKIFEAENGRDALNIAKLENPELILLDINMPEMDGTDVKVKLNENKSTANIPVIFVTGNIDTSDKVQGFNLGIDDYITKPFSLKELLARVEATLSRRKFYEEISMTDGLTGLMNLHYFKKQYNLFYNLAKRHKEPIFSLAIVDVDNFKEINDKHGHNIGDFVLKTLSATLTETLRKTDIITRYGGDEFTIIFPQNTKKEAKEALERIRAKITGKTFTDPDTGRKISFSVSIGISEYSDSYENEAQMFADADVEMYSEKKTKQKGA